MAVREVLREFRNFVVRGNVLDLAVGVVIGSAFTAVTTSMVENILTPLTGLLGVPDFSDLELEVGAATLAYGLFLNAAISLLLIAGALFFLVVRPVNRLEQRRRPAAAPPAVRDCPECLSTIAQKARRCPQCTSVLEPEAEEEPAAG